MKKLETGEVAKALGVSDDRVRQLEAKGLLRAERTTSGTRLFDAADVKRLAAERAAQRTVRRGK
jgi:excisionase family DNA binding protein